MFTGIIQATAPVVAIEEKKKFRVHHIRFPASLLNNLVIGASVSHNGCCLTVTKISDNVVSFDIMQETLRLTNLGTLKVGDEINLERAATLQAEIGGHLMSGHIMCIAELKKNITLEHNQKVLFFIKDKAIMKYILHKGYIGVDGISLTVGEVKDNYFWVHLIPETILSTTLSKKTVGDVVNIEIDTQTQAIVDTVERVLTTHVSILKSECNF